MGQTAAPDSPVPAAPAGLGFSHRQILVTMSGLVIAMLVGLVGFFGGFAVLAIARRRQPLIRRS